MAKNPKGRAGSSRLGLVTNETTPRVLPGARSPRPTGPKPVQLTGPQGVGYKPSKKET